MHKRKPWKCSICGQEVVDEPMPVLKHQLSHVRRRPYTGVRQQPGSDHDVRCPFCSEVYDARDLDQVLRHYEHQVAAGLPAIELSPDEEVP